MHACAGRLLRSLSAAIRRPPRQSRLLLRRGSGRPRGGPGDPGFLGDPGREPGDPRGSPGDPPGGAHETPGGARRPPGRGPWRPWGVPGRPAEGPVRPWGLGDPIPALPATARLFPARVPVRPLVSATVWCRVNPSREARRPAGWDSTTWGKGGLAQVPAGVRLPRHRAGASQLAGGGSRKGVAARAPVPLQYLRERSVTSGRRAGRGCLSTLFSLSPASLAPGRAPEPVSGLEPVLREEGHSVH